MNSAQKQTLSRRRFLKLGLATAAIASSPQLIARTALDTPVTDITWLPGWKLKGLMARKILSPVELTEHFLSRIERLNPLLHAYITVDYDGALAQARAAEKAVLKGEKLGPLHGLPISIKDLFMTKGLRTTQGSMIYQDYVPEIDEIFVERLREAGAVILGKTQTPEFATYPRTQTLLTEECVNPWNTKHITGASSGGSGAAVAAGISCFSIGSDGGGSTRLPACFNGVFGFQPSAGRVPSRTLQIIQMASAGPMTQCVMDAAALTQVISGYDPRDPSSIELPSPNFLGKLHRGIKGCKIAWSRDWGVIPEVDRNVIDQVEQSVKRFSEAGAIIEAPNIRLPDEKAWEVFLAINELSLHRGSRLLDFTPEQHALLTPPTQAMLERVKHRPKLSQQQIIRIMESRSDLQTWIDSIFSNYDLICTPTMGQTAPPIPEQDWQQPYSNDYYAHHLSTCYTYIANVLGLPAASVPCGFIDGLPVGMQIIGPRFADTLVMRAAQVFSEIQPWIHHHPQIAL